MTARLSWTSPEALIEMTFHDQSQALKISQVYQSPRRQQSESRFNLFSGPSHLESGESMATHFSASFFSSPSRSQLDPKPTNSKRAQSRGRKAWCNKTHNGQREYRGPRAYWFTACDIQFYGVHCNWNGFFFLHSAAFWERSFTFSSFREKSSFSGDIKGDKSGG